MPRIRFAPQTRMRFAQGLLVLIFSLRGVSRNAASIRRLPDRVPDNTWQPTKSRRKVYSRCQPPDIGYLDNAARPHKVHAKPLKARVMSSISDRAANLARSVR